MPIHLDPDDVSIAQEFERVNPAARIEIEAEILRARHGRHHPPLDFAQGEQPAGAHLAEHLLPLIALRIGARRARGGDEQRGEDGGECAVRHGRAVASLH